MIEINGSSLGSPNNIYGNYPSSTPSNFPSGVKGRGEIYAMVQLTAGDTFKIKGWSANLGVTTTIKNDGSCKLTVVKLN